MGDDATVSVGVLDVGILPNDTLSKDLLPMHTVIGKGFKIQNGLLTSSVFKQITETNYSKSVLFNALLFFLHCVVPVYYFACRLKDTPH